jgi:hypothetical protein
VPLRREIRAAQPPPDAAANYRIVAGRIVRIVPTNEGIREVPLANWAGRIVEEVIHDDGAERTVMLAVEGALQDGTPLPRVEVSAADWPYMRWPVQRWGPRAVVLAGAPTADHLRVAVQLLSGDVPRRTVYGHTGWRDIGGQWVYLHAGGAVGASGPACDIAVSLPDALAGYILPDPPTGRILQGAIQASLRVLDLAPDRVTVPLLGAVYRAVLGPCDSALNVVGPTGAGKSEAAALTQQHFGAVMDARHLPASWSSTSNALEGLAFAAAHAVLTVDDFAPGGTAADVARMHRDADRLLRAQGNRAGRMRLRADATLRPAKPPRGIIVLTGEDIPRGQSLRARLLTLELGPDELDWAHLTACQRDAAAGRYAEALAGYLRWLAPRYAAVRDELPVNVAAIRESFHADGLHARTPGILADLAIGWRYWLDFALAAGAIGQAERDRLAHRVWAALQEIGAAQAEHVAAAEPCAHFLRLLSGALASGRAHVAGKYGDRPADSLAWGWREISDGAPGRWEAQGRCVGWLDGADLYLEPEASYAEAQEMARHQGDGLSVGARTLWRRMREHRPPLLASCDVKRRRNTVRRTVGGARDRDVIHLRADTLSTYTLPSAGSANAAGAADSRADGSDSSDSSGPADCPPNGTAGRPKGRREDGSDSSRELHTPADAENPTPSPSPRLRGTL